MILWNRSQIACVLSFFLDDGLFLQAPDYESYQRLSV